VVDSETITVGGSAIRRYHGANADHNLVVDSETFSYAPFFEQFCAFYAGHGADVWSLGHSSSPRLSVDRCAQHLVDVGRYAAAANPAQPTFVMGVLQSGAAACLAVLNYSSFLGAVLVGPTGGHVAELSCQVKHNGSTPPPTLRIMGSNDPRSIRPRVAGTAVDTELYVHAGGLARLMNSPAGLRTVVSEWCYRQMNNHLNPRWWTWDKSG
jgi:hypothetical protein